MYIGGVEQRLLGRSDLQVSAIGFGAWQLGGHGWGQVSRTDGIAAVRRALERGVTLFDTADVYGLGESERVLSEALGHARHETVIATKFGVRIDAEGRASKDISTAHLQKALAGSLERLKIEAIPLYQVHWPDGITPVAQVLDALEGVRARGMIRWYGLSNFPAEEVAAAAAWPGLASVQLRFNLIDAPAARPVLAAARAAGIGSLAHTALAQGLLAGRRGSSESFPVTDVRSRSPYFRSDELAANLPLVRRLENLASRLGRTPGQVALRWVIDSPGISSALCGCKTSGQVDQNCAIDFELSASDRRELEGALPSPDGDPSPHR